MQLALSLRAVAPTRISLTSLIRHQYQLDQPRMVRLIALTRLVPFTWRRWALLSWLSRLLAKSNKRCLVDQSISRLSQLEALLCSRLYSAARR